MPTPPLPTKIRLEIVTPERLLLSDEVDEVTIPGSEGYLGILPGHLPLLTMLGTGVLAYRKGTQKWSFAASGGFAEVLPDRVIIMADSVERPEEIDVERARVAKDRAQRQLSSKDHINVEETMASMMRAISRIEVAESARK
ncbi:MAG TPA: F0F1 ATP synthase subunit epsilon [Acidobacteriota bacterium]|nr:F0F1 ATP synthase subunit epsilon [Acidobacteriota bacterium]